MAAGGRASGAKLPEDPDNEGFTGTPGREEDDTTKMTAEEVQDELEFGPEDGEEYEEQLAEELADQNEKIDDPVRMYLTQMGEIPLLSREKELTLAKRIEVYRKRFRFLLVSNHEMLQRSVDILEKVRANDLAFDRTLKIAGTDTTGATKPKLTLRLNAIIDSAKEIIRETYKLYLRSREPQLSDEERRELVRAIKVRRRRGTLLLEECGIQIKIVRPWLDDMRNDYRDMKYMRRLMRGTGKAAERAAEKLRALEDKYGEEFDYTSRLGDYDRTWTKARANELSSAPSTMDRRMRMIEKRFAAYEKAATCASWSRSRRSTATAG